MKNNIAESMMEAKAVNHSGGLIRTYLEKYKIKGKMLEVGGSGVQIKKGKEVFQRHKDKEDYWQLEYFNLDLKDDRQPNTTVGDILKAPYKDNTFDFVFSADTFEHITEPWVAAKEMVRILKPGGICAVVTLFSWRYHCSPIDYWRYSPACLAYLFKGLDCLEANWDMKNRRQDHRGSPYPKKYYDNVPLDKLGGFRENIRVYFIGIKNE